MRRVGLGERRDARSVVEIGELIFEAGGSIPFADGCAAHVAPVIDLVEFPTTVHGAEVIPDDQVSGLRASADNGRVRSSPATSAPKRGRMGRICKVTVS